MRWDESTYPCRGRENNSDLSNDKNEQIIILFRDFKTQHSHIHKLWYAAKEVAPRTRRKYRDCPQWQRKIQLIKSNVFPFLSVQCGHLVTVHTFNTDPVLLAVLLRLSADGLTWQPNHLLRQRMKRGSSLIVLSRSHSHIGLDDGVADMCRHRGNTQRNGPRIYRGGRLRSFPKPIPFSLWGIHDDGSMCFHTEL